jgi:hypothetical protein
LVDDVKDNKPEAIHLESPEDRSSSLGGFTTKLPPARPTDRGLASDDAEYTRGLRPDAGCIIGRPRRKDGIKRHAWTGGSRLMYSIGFGFGARVSIGQLEVVYRTKPVVYETKFARRRTEWSS